MIDCLSYNNRLLSRFSTSLLSSSSSSSSSSSLKYNVYIEYTDHFQVMYYANYMVFLERALCSLTNNHCSRIANIKTIKFKKPALLGTEKIIML